MTAGACVPLALFVTAVALTGALFVTAVALTVALFVTAVALLDKEAHQAILKIHPLSMSSSICFNSSAMTVNTGTALLPLLAAAPLKIAAELLLLFVWK